MSRAEDEPRNNQRNGVRYAQPPRDEPYGRRDEREEYEDGGLAQGFGGCAIYSAGSSPVSELSQA